MDNVQDIFDMSSKINYRCSGNTTRAGKVARSTKAAKKTARSVSQRPIAIAEVVHEKR